MPGALSVRMRVVLLTLLSIKCAHTFLKILRQAVKYNNAAATHMLVERDGQSLFPVSVPLSTHFMFYRRQSKYIIRF
jgi:hypothetical protein